ncbi:MAG TPA: hypothetical protein PKG95_10915, partial [Anaerolineaceae bacterium]|nr:hypothetical protein [Anaerolineaceae bacterium]
AAQWLETEGITFADFNCNEVLSTQNENTFVAAAQNTATLNNITNLVNDPGHDPSNEINGVEVVCVRNGLRRYLEVYTVITSEQEGSFAHLFNNGPITNTVTAVARVIPHTPPAYGGSIVALGACTCTDTGIIIGGNATLTVTDGGMWANRDIGVNGSYDVRVQDSNGNVMPGSVNCLDDCNIVNDPNFKPDAVDLCVGDPRYNCPDLIIGKLDLPEPTCGTYRGAFSLTTCKDGICQPGRYTGGQVNQEHLSLMPGLYCITGDLNINSKAVFESIPDASGHNGVTIFVKGPSGKITIQGGDVDLSAALTPEQVTNGAIQGVLIFYQNGHGDDKYAIRITGNGSGNYTGMIYSPDNGLYVSGTSAGTFTGQIIVRWFEAKGTEDMQVTFADYTNLATPTMLQLNK